MTEAPLHAEALLLSPYLDRVLEPGEAARLEAHLAGCDACRRQLEGLRQTVALVRALPQEAMPRAISIPVRRVRDWEWRGALMPLAGAAAALVLAVGAYSLGRAGTTLSPGAASIPISSAAKGTAGASAYDSNQRALDAAAAPAKVGRASADSQVTLTVTSDRSVYAPSETVVITTRTTGLPNRAALQIDRNGYRVPIAGGVATGAPDEVRSRLSLAALSPPVAPGDYRIVATLPLPGGEAQLVAEVSITVR